jgi:hypothetical protein
MPVLIIRNKNYAAKQVRVVLTLYTCIWKVFNLNLSWNNSLPDRFARFSSVTSWKIPGQYLD